MKRIFGLVAMMVASISVIVSMLLTKQGLTTHYISNLGLGNYSLIFNMGMITSGVLLAIFFFMNKEILIKISGIISSLGLIGVGIFHIGNFIHQFFASLFFIFIGVVIFLVSINQKKSLFRMFGFLTFFVEVILLIFFNPLIEKISSLLIIVWLFLYCIYMFFDGRKK